LVNKKWRFIPAVILALILLVAGIVYMYTSDYYHADEEAVMACSQIDDSITVGHDSDQQYNFVPENPKAGLVFYPGGKVEYSAYAPLMQELAKNDILCILVKMPLNLAVLDVDAAEDVMARYPEITRWYIGGHSLGGSMAASYAADNADEFEGLLMLAAYSTAELSETDLKVLSIYGSCDKVLNMEKYEEYRGNLPDDAVEIIIEGGNHAGFGSYGAQEGDGDALITSSEQIGITAEEFNKITE